MGLFDNLAFPDNANRAQRAAQLAQDCADLVSNIATDKDTITGALAGANDIIQTAYRSLAQSAVPVKPIDLGESWVSDVADTISPIVAAKWATSALDAAARAWLVRQGRIGEAAFADLMGLPKWMAWGKVGGGLAAAVAVQALIETVTGAVQRDKLRDAIHSLIQPRIKIKRLAMINAQVLLTLQSTIAAYKTVTGVKGITFTKAQLDDIAQTLVDEYNVTLASFTDDSAAKALAQFDQDRQAWTNEDNG